jgi:hypothetical protein
MFLVAARAMKDCEKGREIWDKGVSEGGKTNRPLEEDTLIQFPNRTRITS